MGSNRLLMIPKIETPATFTSEDDYLRHLTCMGAESNYKVITKEICKRIDFELNTIKKTNFARYFLLVQEIIQTARKMDILVGPGRIAAAGSIVNYCLGITGIDPLKHNLLFERFLTSDQITFPCFEFDLEEGGRDKILRWLIEKYGEERVAQMGTFAPNKSLKIHPCAIVIGAENLDKFIPLAKIRPSYWDKEMVFTSCEHSHIEKIGLVKLNFLDLRALSVIKKTVSNIRETKGIDIDIFKIPLDDDKTFELFREGNTEGIFQFATEEMQTNLHQLQPDKFEDLVALNALYRPGPMEKIPILINRKRNDVEIVYDFPEMESRLKETYGIYVYQEQMMLLCQDLARFTSEQSESLFYAFRNNKGYELLRLRMGFIKGATKNGFAPEEKLKKIWTDWCEVAPYLFLKSHAVAYTFIGYQMAYLKANFRDEFE
jgi:DNA polymerase III alpha subunit